MQRLFNRLRRTPSGPPSTSTFAQRKLVAEDTLARAKGIIKAHSAEGATSASTFVGAQLEPLDEAESPQYGPSSVEVINCDAFTVARKIFGEAPDAKGNITVLNLASDQQPAGGWLFSLSKTQEEALCYSSTLYATLKKEYYPWPNVGPDSIAGVYSPGVVIFKNDMDNNCRDLELNERRVVSVITVAAPRHRPLTSDGLNFKQPSYLEDLKGKIRLVYRMAARNDQRILVLGAMGCGAYACPPRLVAEQMKSILLEPEFKGVFKKVVFAVYDVGGRPDSNFAVFSEVFKDTYINEDA
ncbi:hypothetical protein D9611_008174 [Ephemerocybe angulata]|uniref:Microbial-type PARG catalytic domain-containing protein n=1 Tax=Ephemerocybe angulata TaxID=980116 RepID=A0A8H5BZS4_9AGAR|nr:hypothetical protein D9611_008174 [Tulosesus angulatus]